MDSVERFFAACQGRMPIRVELTPRDGGSSIGVGFEKPFLLVGRAAGADMGVDNSGTALRQLYMQLIGGRLFAIQLSEEFPTRLGEEHWRAGWVSPEDRFDISEATLKVTNPVQQGAPPTIVVDPTASTPQGRILFSLECGMGSSHIKRVDNSRQILLIGRSAPAKLRVKDRTLCPIHAAIVTTPSSFWIVDLSFEGGVTVNDELVQFAEIQPGDQFTLGRVPFTMLPLAGALPQRTIVRVEGPTTLQPMNLQPSYPTHVAPGSPALPEDRMTPVLEELAKFQSHSFEQCRQILGTVMQMVGVVLSEQRSFVKDELDRMERIMMTLAQQNQQNPSLPQAPPPAAPQPLPTIPPPPQVPTVGPSAAGPMPQPPVATPPVPPAAGHPATTPGPGPVRPNASPLGGVTPPPSGLNDLILHSWVEQQLQSLQVEQESLWQRVKRAISGDTHPAT